MQMAAFLLLANLLTVGLPCLTVRDGYSVHPNPSPYNPPKGPDAGRCVPAALLPLALACPALTAAHGTPKPVLLEQGLPHLTILSLAHVIGTLLDACFQAFFASPVSNALPPAFELDVLHAASVDTEVRHSRPVRKITKEAVRQNPAMAAKLRRILPGPIQTHWSNKINGLLGALPGLG